MSDLSAIHHDPDSEDSAFIHERPDPLDTRSRVGESSELWLCIDLPRLPVEALNADQTRPSVVVQGKAVRVEVQACNRVAEASGIRLGMSLEAALSLQKELDIYERDPGAEQRKLDRLADWSLGFSDRVALYGDHSVVISIWGSLRYFGGLPALYRKVIVGLDELGCEHEVAIAASPRAAFWLALESTGRIVQDPRQLASALHDLPVSMVARDERQLGRMQRSGIRTLGDLMRLPRDGVARRFGASTLQTLDLALARRPEAVSRYKPAESFLGERTFYLPTRDLGLVRPAARALLEDLGRYLAGRQMATRRFYCDLMRDSQGLIRIEVGCRHPAYKAGQMMLLLEEHLSRLQLETDVTSIALSCVDIQPLDSQQAELFPERMSATRSCSGLLDQLEARLGPGVLKQLSVCQDYRPERASLDTVSRAWCGIPGLPPRPFFLLENPEPLDIHEGRPCWHGPLDRLMPVERIEQGWWDGCDIRRDYCVAENPEGSRLWIYHDRVFRGWFLHGLFA